MKLYIRFVLFFHVSLTLCLGRVSFFQLWFQTNPGFANNKSWCRSFGRNY